MNEFNPPAPHSEDELGQLMSALCDGTLTESSRDRLAMLLHDNPAAKLSCAKFLDLHARMLWRFREQSHPATADSNDTQSSPHLVVPQSLGPPVPSSHRSPVLGFLANISRHVPGGEFTVGGLLIIVIVAAFWGLSQAILFPRFGGHDLAELSAGSEGGAVATIRDTTEVEWSPNPSALSPQPSEVTAGQPLSIQSGLIELELKQGTTLLIEGPADWKIDGNNHATLKQGKLVAKVPQQAIGFTLDTPTAKIVDLGTEFGVTADKHGVSSVRVLKGAVDVTARSRASRKEVRQNVVRLVAGQAARADAHAGVVRIPASELASRQPGGLPRQRRRYETRLVALPKDAVVTDVPWTGNPDDFPAKNAIDGDRGTFSHSGAVEGVAKWQLNLGRPLQIGAVEIWNRGDVCRGRFRDITISILAADGKTVLRRTDILNPDNRLGRGMNDFDIGPEKLSFDLLADGPVNGQFVEIERKSCNLSAGPGDNDILSIAELMVYEAVEVVSKAD